MRAFMTAIAGLATASLYIILGVMLGGLPGAAVLVLGVVAAAVSTGAGIAAATRPLRDRRPRLKRTRAGRTTHRGHDYACSHCGADRELRGHVWVCADCDLRGMHLLEVH